MDGLTILFIIMGVAAAEGLVYLLFKNAYQNAKGLKNPARSHAVHATITSKRSTQAKHGMRYIADIHFQDVHGTQYNHDVLLQQSRWAALQEGDVLEVVYLKDNPKVVMVPEDVAGRIKQFSLVLKIIPLSLAASVLVIYLVLRFG